MVLAFAAGLAVLRRLAAWARTAPADRPRTAPAVVPAIAAGGEAPALETGEAAVRRRVVPRGGGVVVSA